MVSFIMYFIDLDDCRVPSAPTFPAWPATSSSSPCYLHITTSPQVVTGSIQPAMEQFWASVIQKVVKPQHALSEK